MKRRIFSILLLVFVYSGFDFFSNPEQIKKERSQIKYGQTLNKHKAVVIAQACLLGSKYVHDYDFRSYQTRYDKGQFPNTGLWFQKLGHPAWFISFNLKEKLDKCMYGAVVFEDGTENNCGCMYGM